jgi:hypothetical protein
MRYDTRQYLLAWMRQFGIMMMVYIAATAICAWGSTLDAATPVRAVLVLLPVLPGLALIGLTVRAYRQCDHLIQLRMLQAAALAAIVVAVFATVYYFLELLGLPRLSAAWISNIVWAVFMVQMVRLIASGS